MNCFFMLTSVVYCGVVAYRNVFKTNIIVNIQILQNVAVISSVLWYGCETVSVSHGLRCKWRIIWENCWGVSDGSLK